MLKTQEDERKERTLMQDGALIDLHSHILPAIDDGSPDVETSLEMLHRESAQGVDTVCATSHYNFKDHSIPTFCTRREEAFARLTAAAEEEMPQVRLAAEVAYFPHMEEEDLSPLCIEGTHTLMLEMPFSDWTDMQIETVEALVLDRPYQVVLVHPERFGFSQSNRDRLEKLAELPIGLQINAGSLIRWSTRKLALELLKLAPYPLLGSDCHNLRRRPPNLKEGRAVVQKKLGWDFLRQMDQNAEDALRGLEWSI